MKRTEKAKATKNACSADAQKALSTPCNVSCVTGKENIDTANHNRDQLKRSKEKTGETFRSRLNDATKKADMETLVEDNGPQKPNEVARVFLRCMAWIKVWESRMTWFLTAQLVIRRC